MTKRQLIDKDRRRPVLVDARPASAALGLVERAALLATLAGLVGIGLGRFWDTRSESRRWHRDQRMLSYRAVAGDVYQYRDAIRELARAPRP